MKLVEKPYIHDAAKRTLRGMQKSLTPRLATLYGDGKRRNDILKERAKE